mgnify:CR=1 FL=1
MENVLLTPDDFILLYPVFAREDRNVILRELESAHRNCSPTVWTNVDSRKEAIALLTAHWIAMNLCQEGALASVAVESVAGNVMQIPKMDGPNNGSEFASTIYGQRYLKLWKSLPKMGFVV